MKEPKGELVELDFYFHHAKRVDAFARLVKYCCGHGGSFAGKILQSEGIGTRNHKYKSIADRPVRELSINDNELERKLKDEDTDIIKIAIWLAIGTTKEVPEIVTYCGVSSEASQVDSPSIAIVGEGWVFSTPGYKRQAKNVGKRCYEKFVEICNALDPDYAAILNENSLPCSFDLRFGAGNRCFTNFFVSERSYNASSIKAIETLYNDSFTERLDTGIYVSTWSMYNPRNISIEIGEALKRSTEVAKMLAK